MHEYDVSVAAPRQVERLPGAERDHAHLDPRLLLEDRKQVAEQARLLGRGGRRDYYELVLRQRGQRRGERRKNHESPHPIHGSSPFMNAAACADCGFEKNCSTGARSTSRPRSRNTISSPRRRAWPRLWVAMTILVPAASKARIAASTSRVALGSRLAVGSSRNSTSGCSAPARARARRCCSPPESTRADRRARCASPTPSSASCTSGGRCALGTPAIFSA